MNCRWALLLAAVGQLPSGGHAAPRAVCPGDFALQGIGNVSLIPTGWASKEGAVEMAVEHGRAIKAHMGGRAYFASYCTAGTYDNAQYLALDLRGKTLTYTTDLSGAGCGCNAAFYLVSMHQNDKPSDCGDHYCDANNVCGESCSEIDIQEGNQYSWHSTLHGSQDHGGLGKGYGGGGAQWSGFRDWTGADYGPDARCIDTKAPFEVSVSFPTNNEGLLISMDITLSQKGKGCPLSLSIGNYAAIAELDAALGAGMTPVVSYWNSGDMLWMDGKGMDGQGPCSVDLPDACPDTVKFYGFSVTPAFPATTPNPNAATTTPPPGKGSSWIWCIIGAFVGGIVLVLALEALAVLGVWAIRKYRMRNGTSLLRTSSLPSVTSLQNLALFGEAAGAKTTAQQGTNA